MLDEYEVINEPEYFENEISKETANTVAYSNEQNAQTPLQLSTPSIVLAIIQMIFLGISAILLVRIIIQIIKKRRINAVTTITCIASFLISLAIAFIRTMFIK